jgi:uncharacterized protein (DUF433 family)
MLEETTSIPETEHWQIQGEARLLIRSLERKFGTLDEHTRTTIYHLDSDTLLDCVERLATAHSVADVLPYTNTTSPPVIENLPVTPLANTEQETELPTVFRTDKGLTIAGTRLTLYDILDYLKQQWSPTRIQQWFRLNDTQIADIMEYIHQQRWEVEAEYREVLEYTETKQQYWMGQNRSLRERQPTPSKGRTEFWTTLRKRQLERRQN